MSVPACDLVGRPQPLTGEHQTRHRDVLIRLEMASVPLGLPRPGCCRGVGGGPASWASAIESPLHGTNWGRTTGLDAPSCPLMAAVSRHGVLAADRGLHRSSRRGVEILGSRMGQPGGLLVKV